MFDIMEAEEWTTILTETNLNQESKRTAFFKWSNFIMFKESLYVESEINYLDGNDGRQCPIWNVELK